MSLPHTQAPPVRGRARASSEPAHVLLLQYLRVQSLEAVTTRPRPVPTSCIFSCTHSTLSTQREAGRGLV